MREIELISNYAMHRVSEIKLIRTDTTLDLSQKAEKVRLTPKRPVLSKGPDFCKNRLWDAAVADGARTRKEERNCARARSALQQKVQSSPETFLLD